VTARNLALWTVLSAVGWVHGCGLDFDAAFSQTPDGGQAGAGGSLLDGSMDQGAGGTAASDAGQAGAAAGGASGGSTDAQVGGAAGAATDAGDGGAGTPCPLKLVQSGSATFPELASELLVPIQPVEMSHAILLFGVSFAEGIPADSQIAGQLASPGQLRFQRFAASSDAPVMVRWYVAEFQSCVQVQRGTTSSSAPTQDIALPQPVDLATSFPVLSFRGSGTFYGVDDTVQARISSPTTLTLSGSPNADPAIDWQVVSFETAAVQTGNTVLGPNEMVKTVDLEQGFDPDSTWLLFSYALSGMPAGGSPGGAILVTGTTLGTSKLSFERQGTGGTVSLAWYAVSFTHGARVSRGTLELVKGQAEAFTTLPGFDPARSVATAGGLYQRGGSILYDLVGIAPGSAQLTIAASQTLPTLAVSRGASQAPATFNWFAVEFP
jgi:hypothetical protein